MNDSEVPITSALVSSVEFMSGLNMTPSISPQLAPAVTSFEATTTISSFVEVTATQTGLATEGGRVITVKPSDVFSSAIVYTTIIIQGGPGKGLPPDKVYMIIGLVLGIVALLMLPVIIWLILWYRRRPSPNCTGGQGVDPYRLDTGYYMNSSRVGLVKHGAPPGVSDVPRRTRTFNGEKRLAVIPEVTQQSSPAHEQVLNPFADPARADTNASRLRLLPRLTIPDSTRPANPSQNERRGSSLNTPGSAMSLSVSQLQEKVVRSRSQRTLAPERVEPRLFVPGRAVDIGPISHSQEGDLDENGLLPPDYTQATQPLSARAGPGPRL